MTTDNFKKYENKDRIVPNIMSIAINLKDYLINLQLLALSNEELRQDLWQDIKNLSNCINELIGAEVVSLDEVRMDIKSIKI